MSAARTSGSRGFAERARAGVGRSGEKPLSIARAAAAALLCAIAGCQTVQTTRPGVVGVERPQAMLLSSEQVNRSAALAYQQELKKAARAGALNRDPAQLARVRGIVQRLVPATAAFRPDAPRWAWEVNVVSSPDINAWAMPGGKMAVHTGLLERLRPTDDELAAAIGHEMAHALREHGRERASRAVAQGLALSAVALAVGAGEASLELAQLIADLTLNLPNSREHEREADRIGVELAARAGFDPRAALTLWQKMARAGGVRPPQFLSTHPSPENRMRDLADSAARVMPLYESARRR